MILIGLDPHATELNFLTPVPAKNKGAFSYTVLCVMRLTYTRGLVRFSNCVRLSRLDFILISIKKHEDILTIVYGRMDRCIKTIEY